MKKVVLAGNAITANILNGYLQSDERYKVTAAVADDDYLDIGGVDGVPSVRLSELLATFPPTEVAIIMAMGYNDLNRSRESLFARLKDMGYIIETYVHPDAHVYSRHPLGEGCVVLPGAVIEPYVHLSANSMVWCNVTLAHHSSIAENCWIASGAVISGQANVSRNSFIGVNATVVNKITVGEFNVIGGGALITKDTKANSVHLARSAEEWRYPAEDYVKYFGI